MWIWGSVFLMGVGLILADIYPRNRKASRVVTPVGWLLLGAGLIGVIMTAPH